MEQDEKMSTRKPVTSLKGRSSSTPSRAREELESTSLLTSATLIGVTALVMPELLAGMAIGAGIVVASKWLPDVTHAALRPAVRTALKAGYAAVTTVHEVVTEAAEEVQDMLAEARAHTEGEGRGGVTQ
jgi:hypothetical protein